MEKNWKNRRIILAISQVKDFEKFIKTNFEICVFMNLHISLLHDLIYTAHKCGKKVYLHLDLIQGLSADEYGCEYACQKLCADGIISTRAKVVETARKNNKVAILRLFLIDTKSLNKGLKLCQAVNPDYVEVLPAIASSIFPYIRDKTQVPIMGGGLIRSKDDLDACFAAGVCAVTISNLELAAAYQKA